MTEIMLLLLFLMCLVGCFVLVAILLSTCDDSGDSHEAKVRRMKAKEMEARREIDQTTEYWVGLYTYIAQRLDDESRRRQSG